MTDIACLDAGVWVKVLVEEELSGAARRLMRDLARESAIVAPAFCWAEVGSTLRKKIRMGLLSTAEADQAWTDFRELPATFVDSPALRERSWQLAAELEHPTLYDAAYMACTELLGGGAGTFWTADDGLVRLLGSNRPPWVRHVREVLPPSV